MKPKHIHLSGICGTAMASLAGLLREKGCRVTGSDAAAYPPMSDQLREMGIDVAQPYAEANLDALPGETGPDLVVIGNALSRGNPEVERVLDERIPFTSMAAVLREEFLAGRESLVVAGTHGKTTTTSMLAWIYQTASRENPLLEPSFLIGGVAENFGTSYQTGLQPLMLAFGCGQRKADPLQCADRLAIHCAKTFFFLVHGIQDRREHARLILPASFIDERINFQVNALLKKSHQLQRKQHNDRRDGCRNKQPRAAGHANRRYDENTRRTGHSADAAARVNNQTGAEESDALHDIRCYLSPVRADVASQNRGEQRKQGAAHTDEHVRAHTGSATLGLALQPNSSAQEARQQQPRDRFVLHQRLLQPAEIERQA